MMFFNSSAASSIFGLNKNKRAALKKMRRTFPNLLEEHLKGIGGSLGNVKKEHRGPCRQHLVYQ